MNLDDYRKYFAPMQIAIKELPKDELLKGIRRHASDLVYGGNNPYMVGILLEIADRYEAFPDG